MADIKLSSAESEALVHKLRTYCIEELDFELGNLSGQLFIDFLIKEIGPVLYNKGVADSQAYLQERIEYMVDELYKESVG